MSHLPAVSSSSSTVFNKFYAIQPLWKKVALVAIPLLLLVGGAYLLFFRSRKFIGFGEWSEPLKHAMEQKLGKKIFYIEKPGFTGFSSWGDFVIAVRKPENFQTNDRPTFFSDSRYSGALSTLSEKMGNHYILIVDLSDQKKPIPNDTFLNLCDSGRKMETLLNTNRLFLWRPDEDTADSIAEKVFKKISDVEE